MSILFFISIALIFGFIGGKIVHRFRLPRVVGYLVAGLIFGPSFLGAFSLDSLEQLNLFTDFALSLVAFIIGSEMKLSTLKEMGRGIGIITILESLGAFLLVTMGVYLLTKKLYLALVFGALAPASAPAGTVAVLQECKAKGRLTNALYAVVGLDDGLAIMIFAVAVALSKLLLTGKTMSIGSIFQGPIMEIVSSIALGCFVGIITGYFTRWLSTAESVFTVTLGGILVCTGIAEYFHFSLILANLSLGLVFVNLFSAANKKAYRAIQSISLPVYIIFFFLAGAHLQIALLPSMGLLGLVYLICRSCGLIGGAFLGATVTEQQPVIRKYLGLGILSQAGVAIGLALLVSYEFGSLGQEGQRLAITAINTIAATTIIFEIIGPIGTKFAITRAGEIGANITEDDLIETYKVRDVMDTKVPVISASTSLSEVIKVVSSTDSFYYPVVDNNKKLIGAITLDGIRNTFATQELNDWLVALDIMEPIISKITPDIALSEAFEKARRLDIEILPVVDLTEDNKFIGILNCRAVRRQLSAEVLSRQQKADTIASLQHA